MHIKDIEVGRTYRYAIQLPDETQTGTVTVEEVDGPHGFPISGPSTLDKDSTFDGDTGLFTPDELIEEVR